MVLSVCSVVCCPVHPLLCALTSQNFCWKGNNVNSAQHLLKTWILHGSLKGLNKHCSINISAHRHKHTGKHAHTHTHHSGMPHFSKLIIFREKNGNALPGGLGTRCLFFSFSLPLSLHYSLFLLPVYPSLPPSLYNITLPHPGCIMPVRHTAI